MESVEPFYRLGNIPLSTKGIQEALEGGKTIKDIPIDIIIMTTLIRSQMTAMLAMSQHSSGKVPVVLHQGEGKLEEWANIFNEEALENTIPVIRCWELTKECMESFKDSIKLKPRKNLERIKSKFGEEAMTSPLPWRKP